MSSHFVSRRRMVQSSTKVTSVRQASVGLALLLALSAVFAGPLWGQQATSGDAAKADATRADSTGADSTGAQAPRKKAAGRLPAHFAAVVSPKQRAAIYKLQAGYELQLEKLREQMAALIADRAREVDEILDADQLAEVTKKREEAKKKRASRSSSRSATKTATDG